MTSRTSFRFKIAVVGDDRVGKTSFVQQGVGEEFPNISQSHHPKVLYLMKTEFIDTGIELYIWDADGVSKHGLQEMDYRKADAVIMVYDITEWSSFERVKTRIDDLKESTESSASVISIVGNKSDLEDERQGRVIVQNFAPF